MRTRSYVTGLPTRLGWLLSSLDYWRHVFSGSPCYCPECEGIWY